MEYAVVRVPAAPVRRKPNHRREMVNQLLFGEKVAVLKSKGPMWVKVRSLHDEYEGWMTTSLLLAIDKKEAMLPCRWVATDLLNPVMVNNEIMQVPAGSTIPFLDGQPGDMPLENGKLGDLSFSFRGAFLERTLQKPGSELLTQIVMPWLNAPYLWGGRTPLGVDCSGFTQVIYKMMGIDLPRDAWQQAQTGSPVKKYNEVRTGDLAFFNNKEDIVHVGIFLDKDRLIHASGRVKIDNIDKKGVTDAATGKRILSLRAVRRIW
ncbi:MAG: C40 family peptidase [Bacteroidetes bacterium]|nr:C40 family peptidase [Bacteroidota bacterium]